MSDSGGTGRIDAVHREVGSRRVDGAEARTVLLRRTYDAPVGEVWDACTDRERVSRWFVPVSGELKPGGHYLLEGHAHGEVLRCEAPRLLRLSWLFGDDPDFGEVELRLTAEGGADGDGADGESDGDERTVLELEHVSVVPDEVWEHFGPGALGLVWDLTALGLHFHLLDGPADDLAAWRESDEARELMTRSSEAWGAAYEASGAPADVVAEAVSNTTAFYVRPREDAE
ncbi:polyketide cyclase [Streptomyces sp. HNM0575]|uniref:SRPBCC domain-containing protein n=1 Tax=Streptomyces sp. HNM0575 TaxID=2716338 RepID=UPI00145EBDC9|nr:SRPBCC domain-containing protein [Streptomyces sp. HNM0575]NLU75617.1 polyketide cyclase [Streptomyces sp. HNM0575]